MRLPEYLKKTLAAFLVVGASLSPQSLKAQDVTAVVGGTLIDGTGRAPVPNAVVVVEGNHITAAGPASCSRSSRNGTRRVSATW